MTEGPTPPAGDDHGRQTPGGPPDEPAPGQFGVRRSPSGRVPQWALDEAVGFERPEPDHWRDHSPQPAPAFGYARPRRRSHWLRNILVLATVVSLAIGAWFYSGQSLLPQPGAPEQDRPVAGGNLLEPADSGATSFQVEPPPPGQEMQGEPLGTPAPLAERSDSYRFMNAGQGAQDYVAYDPCRPVHYVVRGKNMPDDGMQMIEEAIASVSNATGLQFVYDGMTTENPVDRRNLVQKQRYGDRWAPVLIAWVTEQEEPDVAGGTIGLGGSSYVSTGGSPTAYVSGSMLLDAPQIEHLTRFPGGYSRARAIVMHELGHVVGLDHVSDPDQLMYAESNLEVTEFGAGDLTGLAKLGRGECVPAL
ncbi:matrixin family metalloprotease [Arthrobacter castelli]|uniref:matrixin family metalloprotease n=1 Tax=Arthrobacter castelli TaxID=271431 RepID=UPI000688C6C6|nr:matrixin family metalloprotease [Arthrobacter castelli]